MVIDYGITLEIEEQDIPRFYRSSNIVNLSFVSFEMYISWGTSAREGAVELMELVRATRSPKGIVIVRPLVKCGPDPRHENSLILEVRREPCKDETAKRGWGIIRSMRIQYGHTVPKILGKGLEKYNMYTYVWFNSKLGKLSKCHWRRWEWYRIRLYKTNGYRNKNGSGGRRWR